MALEEAVEAWCRSMGFGEVCSRCCGDGELRRTLSGWRCTDCLRELILGDLEDVA